MSPAELPCGGTVSVDRFDRVRDLLGLRERTNDRRCASPSFVNAVVSRSVDRSTQQPRCGPHRIGSPAMTKLTTLTFAMVFAVASATVFAQGAAKSADAPKGVAATPAT